MRKIVNLAALTLAVGSFCHAADYPKPRELVEQLSQKPAAPSSQPAAGSIEADAAAFGTASGALAPAQAAAQWLELFDRAAKAPPNLAARRFDRNAQTPQSAVMDVLPGPAVWPELRSQAKQRLDAAGEADKFRLRITYLLTLVLNSDSEAISTEIKLLADGATKDRARPQNIYLAQQLVTALGSMDPNPARAIERFESSLRAAEKGDLQGMLGQQVPDLVTIAGEEKAAELLKRLLLLPQMQYLNFAEGQKTLELARKVALQNVDQLKQGPWMLTQDIGLDAVALYEALDKKFAAPAATTQSAEEALMANRSYDDYNRTRARGYYILGLIANDRTDDAAALIAKSSSPSDYQMISPQVLGRLSNLGKSEQVWKFLHARLTADPSLPVWPLYIRLAASTGNNAEMIKLARAASEKPDLSPAVRARVDSNLYRALLAADEVDEGIAVARRIMAAKPATPTATGGALDYEMPGSESTASSAAITLARVGLLLKRDDLVNEAIPAALAALRAERDAQLARAGYSYTENYYAAGLAQIMVDAGRGAEAATFLGEMLVPKQVDQSMSQFQSRNNASLATALVDVYHRAGRSEDVLELFRELPIFGEDDLRDVLTTTDPAWFGQNTKATGTPLGMMAATALAKTGQKEKAISVLKALLERQGGYDPAYELLIELQGNDVTAFLDSIYARDRFEERPLIWKAELLRRAGKLDDAEKTVRQAISIDPSDGEQPRGDRMRAYAVLAEIMAGKGDAEQAKFFKEVITAIRMAEDADRYFTAGLLSRGVKMYEQSLTHFADAYCIQSRLAIQLAQLGKMEEAQKHYQRAYELMPDSFGRVESHCFGCEGVFETQVAQNVAERVFMDLAKKTPDKPQVHYLLGYLRQAQQRYAEALESYRTATKLDADYLNAWSKLLELRDKMRIPTAEADAATLSLIRLDPLGRHASVPWNRVNNLPELWKAVERAKASQLPTTEPLFDLTASRKAKEMQRSSQQMQVYYSETHSASSIPATPQKAIAQQAAISQMLMLLRGGM